MADLISYNMGQIRYRSPSSLYKEDLECFVHPIETESLGNKKYLDLAIYDDKLTTFSQNESYYLKIGIPRNLSFDMTFDLKLLQGKKDGSQVFSFVNRNQFQEIKRFNIARQSTDSLGYSRVILYPEGGEDVNGTPVVAIAKELNDPTTLSNGEVYYKSDEQEYYIKASPNDKKIEQRNDILLNHIWKTDESKELAWFDCVFSNKVTGQDFNTLLVELYRDGLDDDISYEDEDTGKTYNGLHINYKDVKVECYKIINLINNENMGTNGILSFDSIGVWSHPDAIMAINGEEIRIGQSGYYELNDFNITTFGMVINGAEDRFSLDYQYKI